MYDKLGMTIYTTPNITFDKASGLFEGMEQSGLAPVPPAESVNYSNAHDKGHTSNNKQRSKRKTHKKKFSAKNSHAGGPSSRSSRPNSQFKNKKKCPICDDPDHFAYQCPHLDKARSSVKRSRNKSQSSWGEEDGDEGDTVSMITDESQSDFTFSAFSSSSDSGIVDSGSTAMILQAQHIDMVRNLVPSSRTVTPLAATRLPIIPLNALEPLRLKSPSSP